MIGCYFKYQLTKINFDKTTPEHAKHRMERKINKGVMIASVIFTLLFLLISLIYVILVKKGIQIQSSIVESE